YSHPWIRTCDLREKVEHDAGEKEELHRLRQSESEYLIYVMRKDVVAGHPNLVSRHAAEHAVHPQWRLAILFNIVGNFLARSLVLHNVVLIKHLSFQRGLAEDCGDDNEDDNSDDMRQDLVPVDGLHEE